MIPPYSNIYMYMLERKTVHKYIQLDTLKLYKRFIDDVLIIIQSTDHQSFPMLQNDLNSLHQKSNLHGQSKDM